MNVELSANRFTVRDDEGRFGARIGYSADELIGQTFYDASGTARIHLVMDQEGTTRKRLLDQEGYVRVSSSTYPDDHLQFRESAVQSTPENLKRRA